MPFSRDLSPRGLFAVYTAFRSSSNVRICRSAGRFALSHAHPGFNFAGSVLLAGSRKGIFEAFVEFTVQFLVGPHRLLWIHSVLVGRCGVKLISHMMSSFRETDAVRRGWVPEPEEQMQSANVVVWTTRTVCLKYQNSTSNALWANSHSGAPFRRASDRWRRDGGGSPPSKYANCRK